MVSIFLFLTWELKKDKEIKRNISVSEYVGKWGIVCRVWGLFPVQSCTFWYKSGRVNGISFAYLDVGTKGGAQLLDPVRYAYKEAVHERQVVDSILFQQVVQT